MTEKVKETSKSDKKYNDYDRYEKFNRNRFSGHNENIKELIDNENAVKSNQFQFSLDVVTDAVVNKVYVDTTDKSVKGKTINNNDVDIEKSASTKTDQYDGEPVRRSSSHIKHLVRLKRGV